MNKILIALFNFIVAALNFKTYLKTKEARDFWATIAWLAACANWASSFFIQ